MWLAIALVVGFGIAFLFTWMRSKGFTMRWYEWLIGVLGLLLVLFAAQNFFAVNDEFNQTAANNFLMFVGIPGIILMVLAWQLSVRHKKAS